jgi:hypothetical protein
MAERKDGDTMSQKDKQASGAPASASAEAGATSAGIGAAAGSSRGDKGNGGAGRGDRAARGGSQPDAAAAAHEAVADARGVTQQFAGEVRGAAESLLDEGKDRAIGTVHGVAQALRKTAEGLQEAEGGEFVARYAERAADQIERFTDSMRDRHLTDLVADLDDFARRQPTLFLVGAVAAGFVVGRFMAASGERRPHEPAAQGREYRSRASRDGAQGRTGMAGYGAGAYGTRGNA